LTYDSESVKSYELGIKSSLLENRMIFNAAVFYNNWSDKQSINTIPNPNLPALKESFIDNIGKAGALDTLIVVPAGATLPYTPEYTFYLTADYQWSLSSTLTGLVRGQLAAAGESYNTLANEEVGLP
jgi:hypothetical protein